VEGTKALVALSGVLEGDVFGDHVQDVDAPAYFFLECFSGVSHAEQPRHT
jgi:hypothetical protein